MFSENASLLVIDGRYVLDEKLGAGGMGIVYRATDRLTGGVVALKRVQVQPAAPGESDSESLEVVLSREFQMLAGLRHPNIISVLDYGFDAEHQPYYTMTLVENARTILEAGQNQPTAEKARLIGEMLLALAYLHRRGIVHRDLKPRNVLVTPAGQVKVLDFGLAMTDDQPESAAGTLDYIAPEVLGDQGASPQSDLYAVGVIAYELLSGVHPFRTADAGDLVRSILYKTPDLSLLNAASQNGSSESRTDASSTHVARALLPGMGETPTMLVSVLPPTMPGPPEPTPASPDPASDKAVDVSGLAALVGKLLQKSPTLRPRSAEMALAALQSAADVAVIQESAEIRESFLQMSPFSGRSEEIGRLRAALDQARAGRGSAWLIGGESGVGKTRLLDELRIRALVEGALVLRGQGLAEGGLPFQYWREVMRRLALITALSDIEAGVLRSLVPDLASLIGRSVPEPPAMDGSGAQQRLIMTIIDVFKRQRQPILLLLEDLHWADESLEPLRQLIRFAGEQPWLIVGSYRTDETPDLPEKLPEMKHLPLARLDEAAIAALSSAMLGEAGRQRSLVDLLKRESDGNAFFMVEIVRALAEEAGSLSAIGERTLPVHIFTEGVKTIVRRRLARVPAWASPALTLAAVAGQQIDLKVLAAGAALSEDEWERWLTVCVNASVLHRVDDVWRFSHEKLRDALIAALPAAERAALHRAVAQAIEATYPHDPAYAERLAEQWFAAGEDRLALPYILRTVDTLANLTGEYARALKWIDQGLAITADQPDLIDARLDLIQFQGKVYGHTGALDDAYVTYSVGLAAANERPKMRIVMLNGLSRVRWQRGAFAEAKADAETALALAVELGDRESLAASLNTLGNAAYRQGNWTLARRCFADAMTLYDALGIRQQVAASLTNLAILAAYEQDWTTTRGYFEQALSVFRAIGDRYGVALCLSNLGGVATYQRDWESACDYMEQGLSTFRQSGNRYGEVDTLAGLAAPQIMLGQLEAAWETICTGLRLGQQVGATRALIELIIRSAQYCEERGDLHLSAALAGFAESHPAADAETVQFWILPLLERLAAHLAAERFAAAKATYAGASIEAVIAALLNVGAPTALAGRS
ncbi:MAG: protein kinase [Anaerolineae bacterium]|nr:protein kinase [Anaerolineae bacterium]NUQ06436.1 protein kinase [Anaerolineae bacterium]